jgi:IS5 family transposase
MAIPLQLGFTDYEQTYAKKKTRRQIFLEEMEATVPWDSFLALIQPVYYKPTGKGGRPPFPLEVMLRIHLLQQWFTLSDPLMEEMLIDTPCFRRFAGIDMIEGRIPDETTILNFRHLLEEHQIAEQILESVNQSLSEKGVMLRRGRSWMRRSSTRPVQPRTRRVSGILRCTQWPRATSGSLGCAATSALMQPRVWSTPW